MEDEHYTDEYVEKLEKELTELKALVGELIEQWDYSKDIGIDDYIEQLKQACTLANTDSKEDTQ